MQKHCRQRLSLHQLVHMSAGDLQIRHNLTHAKKVFTRRCLSAWGWLSDRSSGLLVLLGSRVRTYREFHLLGELRVEPSQTRAG